jgi:[ribosomal protein S5]-alanine N-acetyltransferase
MTNFEGTGPVLGDGVVALRRPNDGDLGAIDRGLNDDDVVRWFGSPTMSAAELLAFNRQRWDDGTSPTFAICEAGEEAEPCVGHAWISIDPPSQGSIGYWLLPEARGRGLVSRSVILVATWAADELGLERIRILVEPENARSRRVAERCGFVEQGVLVGNAQLEGRSIDHVQYLMPPRG